MRQPALNVRDSGSERKGGRGGGKNKSSSSSTDNSAVNMADPLALFGGNPFASMAAFGMGMPPGAFAGMRGMSPFGFPMGGFPSALTNPALMGLLPGMTGQCSLAGSWSYFRILN